MIDESAKTKYSVSSIKESAKKDRDANHAQLLASKIPSTTLKPGLPQYVWAKFPIPAEVSKVTLYLPDAPPMENLAISSADESPASAQPAGAKSDEGASTVLASEPNNKGARVEVSRVRRTGDGFVEIRWQYVNAGDESLRVLGSDEARDLPREMYVIDPATKKLYGVVTDTKGEPVASKLGSTNVEGGKSAKAWARFAVDKSAKSITLYLPETLPLEDLTIEENAK